MIMKTLICIDGYPNANNAAKTAAGLSLIRNGELVFLYVRRYKKYTRGYDLREKAAAIFDDWNITAPEMRHLHEAEKLFRNYHGPDRGDTEMTQRRKALIQTGVNVFEEGSVHLPSGGRHFKIREGLPHEEIVRESSEGLYDLVILGAHHVHGCHWYDIEHIPLSVAQNVSCPVLMIGKQICKGQAVMICHQGRLLHQCHADLVGSMALDMCSGMVVMNVCRGVDSSGETAAFPASFAEAWSRKGIVVRYEERVDDPFQVLSDSPAGYGLIVCTAGEKRGKKRLDKIIRRLICNGLNLLLLPPVLP